MLLQKAKKLSELTSIIYKDSGANLKRLLLARDGIVSALIIISTMD